MEDRFSKKRNISRSKGWIELQFLQGTIDTKKGNLHPEFFPGIIDMILGNLKFGYGIIPAPCRKYQWISKIWQFNIHLADLIAIGGGPTVNEMGTPDLSLIVIDFVRLPKKGFPLWTAINDILGAGNKTVIKIP